MNRIVEWPLVNRDRIVHAFRPGGDSTAEGPFRTLRRHQWASAGVRVSRHADRGLAGQMTVFSRLNVESARLARRGEAAAATATARAAMDLEASPEFARLAQMLMELPGQEAERVVGESFSCRKHCSLSPKGREPGNTGTPEHARLGPRNSFVTGRASIPCPVREGIALPRRPPA